MKKLSFLILIVVWFSACEMPPKPEEINEKRIAVLEKMEGTFDKLMAQNYLQKSKTDIINTLLQYYPDLANTPGDLKGTFHRRLNKRKNAFDKLKVFYNQYNLLVRAEKNTAINAAVNAYNSVASLKGISEDVKQKLPKLASEIQKSKYSKEVKNKEEIMFEMTSTYATLWKSEKELWKIYIDQIFEHHTSVMANLPDEAFNQEKLQKILNQPFENKELLIELYKKQCENKILEDKKIFLETLNQVDEVLAELCKINKQERVNN